MVPPSMESKFQNLSGKAFRFGIFRHRISAIQSCNALVSQWELPDLDRLMAGLSRAPPEANSSSKCCFANQGLLGSVAGGQPVTKVYYGSTVSGSGVHPAHRA